MARSKQVSKQYRTLEMQVRTGIPRVMAVTRDEKGRFVDTVSVSALTGKFVATPGQLEGGRGSALPGSKLSLCLIWYLSTIICAAASVRASTSRSINMARILFSS